MHGEGCNTLLKHQPDAAQTVGIYMTEAGIIFHSGERVGGWEGIAVGQDMGWLPGWETAQCR